MAVDFTLVEVGANVVLKLPVKGQPAVDFVIGAKFKAGTYVFQRQEIFYTIATGGATSGSTTVQVAETISLETPLFGASLFLFDGADFDEYTYTSLDADTRTFTLDTTVHPTGLSQTYSDGAEAKLESEATVEVDISSSTFEYESGGANDQIAIRAEGSILNLIIPADLPATDYSQTLDTTEIFFQTNTGGLFSPSELPGTVVEWRADSIYWDGANWTSVDGGWRWGRRNGDGTIGTFGAVSEITINNNTWWQLEKLQPDGTTWTVTPFNDGGSGLGFVAFAMEVNDVGNGGLLGGVSSTGQGIKINDSQGIEFENTGSADGDFNFNGVYASGALTLDNDAAYYNHDGVSDVPINTSFVVSGFDVTGLNNADHYQILNNYDDASFRRMNAAKYYGMVMGTDSLTAADKEKLVRYMGFIAEDRGHTNPISSTLPDYNVRPLGGTSAELNLSTPALTITFKNAPTGVALNVWDDEDENTSADHGTQLFTTTPDGTDKVWSAGVTAGNRVIVQWVPASPYAFKEINFPYTIPNDSAEFDFAPLLIAEDGI